MQRASLDGRERLAARPSIVALCFAILAWVRVIGKTTNTTSSIESRINCAPQFWLNREDAGMGVRSMTDPLPELLDQ
jgi:hypothetical protein